MSPYVRGGRVRSVVAIFTLSLSGPHSDRGPSGLRRIRFSVPSDLDLSDDVMRSAIDARNS